MKRADTNVFLTIFAVIALALIFSEPTDVERPKNPGDLPTWGPVTLRSPIVIPSTTAPAGPTWLTASQPATETNIGLRTQAEGGRFANGNRLANHSQQIDRRPNNAGRPPNLPSIPTRNAPAARTMQRPPQQQWTTAQPQWPSTTQSSSLPAAELPNNQDVIPRVPRSTPSNRAVPPAPRYLPPRTASRTNGVAIVAKPIIQQQSHQVTVPAIPLPGASIDPQQSVKAAVYRQGPNTPNPVKFAGGWYDSNKTINAKPPRREGAMNQIRSKPFATLRLSALR